MTILNEIFTFYYQLNENTGCNVKFVVTKYTFCGTRYLSDCRTIPAAMGQIPRSTGRIFSNNKFHFYTF